MAEKKKKKLLVVDASALIHRAFHALPDLTDSKGQPRGAVYGFAKMFLKSIKDLQPDYVLVAMDRPEPTFRKELYIGYQANRPTADPSLRVQFAKVRDLLDALEVPVLEKAGFEADDVIGTIIQNSKVIRQHDGNALHRFVGEIVVLTGDKDLMQLVDDGVSLFVPVRGVSEVALYDADGVMDKLRVRPDQVVDLKGLIGDPSDNYPGIYGIGPKTAEKLLEEFGSFEGIFAFIDENVEIVGDDLRFKIQDLRGFSKAIWKKLVLGRSDGELSKHLAQIRRDVPEIAWDWEEAHALVQSPGKLVQVLRENEFDSLVRQLGLEHEVGEGEQLALV